MKKIDKFPLSLSFNHVSAKYYLNWFTVGKVATKIKG